LKKARGAGIVRIRERRAGNLFHAKVVQAASNGLKAAKAVAHGTPCGKLNESYDGKLLLEAEFA
jgi:hypothetical protein